MNPNYQAIATRYRGYEFRSRLEARYAVFFDLCGWRWSYEPPEFPGWIPDFALGEHPTLVEVKPFYRAEEFAEQIGKIRRSGCTQNVVLFGADPVWVSAEPDADRTSGCTQVGWLLEGDDVWPLHFGFTIGNKQLGLCPMTGSWVNAIWRTPAKAKMNEWPTVSIDSARAELHLGERWAEATNIVKWMPQFKEGAA